VVREDTVGTPAVKKLMPHDIYLGPLFKRKRMTAATGAKSNGDSPGRRIFGYARNQLKNSS